MSNAFTIARRDLAATFRTPTGPAVAALFLALQGIVFWMLLHLLSQPDAPAGAVMEVFFGGTMLYWIALALLATVLPMRLVAEEVRTGTIETLLTAPVTTADVVIGKWLAALASYTILWTPSLLYLVYLRVFDARVDLGPVAAGYLGTLLLGGALMAVGLWASSVTRNQILAATVSFVAFFLILLVGVLEARVASPLWASTLRRVSLFLVMEDFARGIVDSRHIVLVLTATALALAGALRAVSGLRGHARRTGARALTEGALVPALLLLAIAVMVNVIAGRRYVRADWTRAGIYELSPKTIGILDGLARPVNVYVFLYPRQESEQARAVTGFVREILRRFERQAPGRVRVETIDPDRNPTRAEAMRRKYGVGDHDMSQGVVIFESGARSKFVTRDDLVDYDAGEEGGSGTLRAFRGESAFVSALLTVTTDRAPTICFAQGHGEPRRDGTEDGGYADLSEELTRDAYQTRGVDKLTAPGWRESCDLLLIAEPQDAYGDQELVAIDAYVRAGGRLLVMLGPVFKPGGAGFGRVGLEGLAERWGARFGDDLVVDVEHASEIEGPSVWAARGDSYPGHPITDRLGGRVTYWPRTRSVRAVRPHAREIVRSSPDGWAETDLATIRGDADLVFDAGRDVKGPIPVAVAVDVPRPRARLAFLGTGRLVMNYRLGMMVIRDYNRDFVLSTVAWLMDREERTGIGPKIPERVTLSLDAAGVDWAFRLFVVGLPLGAVALAVFVWLRRRV